MQASVEPRTPESLSLDPPATDDNTNVRDEERAFGNGGGGGGTSVSGNGTSYLSTRSSNAQSTTAADEAELQTRASSAAGSSSTNFIKRRTSQMLEAIRAQPKPDAPLPPKLAALVDVYRQSEMAASVRAELEEVAVVEQQQHQQHLNSVGPEGNQEMPDIALENSLTRGRKRASWATQFRILSGRAFKNLYRDPALLTAHYISSVVVACEWFSFFFFLSLPLFLCQFDVRAWVADSLNF